MRGFHQVPKREKTYETDETARPQAEWFYCFRAFENLMKPEARVFEITSPTNISLNYHLNKFYELKYCFWYAECQSVTYLLLSDFGYNNPIYTTGQNGKATGDQITLGKVTVNHVV